MKNCKFVLVLLLAVVFNLNAAGKKAAATPPDAGRETFLFTDSAGRQVELPVRITRIVPSGSLAQMFLLAAAPDLLCAVSSEYNPDAAEYVSAYLATLPVAGQFYGAANLNLEEIARIGPDVVIDIGEPKDSIARDMDDIQSAIGVPVIHITATLRTTPQAFRALGGLLDRREQGEALARFCEKTLAASEEIIRRVGSGKRSVLYCMGVSGLNVLARGTFHTEVLDWMTDNLAVVDNPSGRGSGNEANMEQILLWDPEAILFGAGSVYATAARDGAWRQLRAVRAGAYYEVPQGPYNWMGGPPSINRYL
ncbi:MAG: ABC transporter substrate-binding protein, partial [Spirochaetaceae bacterium]|nr:ABC transporter substrate-binding protein [Spirochaetaceae bacterium]